MLFCAIFGIKDHPKLSTHQQKILRSVLRTQVLPARTTTLTTLIASLGIDWTDTGAFPLYQQASAPSDLTAHACHGQTAICPA